MDERAQAILNAGDNGDIEAELKKLRAETGAKDVSDKENPVRLKASFHDGEDGVAEGDPAADLSDDELASPPTQMVEAKDSPVLAAPTVEVPAAETPTEEPAAPGSTESAAADTDVAAMGEALQNLSLSMDGQQPPTDESAAPELTAGLNDAQSRTLAQSFSLAQSNLIMPMATGATTPLQCTPGVFYSVTAGGYVYRNEASVGGAGFTTVPANSYKLDFSSFRTERLSSPYYYGGYQYANSAPRSYSGSQVNGLAITDKGSTVYALDRNTLSGSAYGYNSATGYYEVINSYEAVSVYRWNSATGSKVADSFVPANVRNSGMNASKFIGGATNPVSDTGYYMGGFTSEWVSKQVWVPGYYIHHPARTVWEYNYYWDSYYQRWYTDGTGRYVTYAAWDEWVPGHWEDQGYWEVRFNLYRYDNATGTTAYVGFVPIMEVASGNTNANGDIAFDADGNLFILYHDGASTVNIVPVLADTLKAAEAGVVGRDDQTTNANYEIKPQGTQPIQVSGSGTQFNGLALNYDGRVVVENSSYGQPATMRLIDPQTGAVVRTTTLPSSASGGWTYGTDLSSCTDYPTITLAKNVTGRYGVNDQFKLEIFRKSTVAGEAPILRSDALTDGPELGLQDEIAGPVAAVEGQTYIVRESGEAQVGTDGPASDLSNYKTTLQCINTNTGLPVTLTKISDTEYSFVVPAATSTTVPVVECTYTNALNAGDVAWTKLGENPTAGQPPIQLGSTVWNLVRTDVTPNQTTQVVDCVDIDGDATNSCLEGTGNIADLDPDPAQFLIGGLQYGTYELRETATAKGYKLLTTPIKFTVDSTKPKLLQLPDIMNYLERGSVTWTKVDGSGAPLAGTTWVLEGPVAGTLLTVEDNTGQAGYTGRDIDPTPGKFKVEKLDYGNYTLRETKAPVGYVYDTTKTYPITLNSTTPDVAVGQVVNRQTRVDWSKVDSANTATRLGGSEWTITPQGGTAFVVTDCTAAPCTGRDTNPAPGEFGVVGLAPGTYTIVESKAPAGYDPVKGTWTLVMTATGWTLTSPTGVKTTGTVPAADATKPDTQKYALFDIADFPNTKITGSVTWDKVGAPWADQPNNIIYLSGSTWELVKVTGNGGAPVAGATPLTVTDCNAATAASCTGPDKDPAPGKFQLTGLDLGWYRLVEKSAPLGFIKDETPRYVEITSTSRTPSYGQISNQVVDTLTLPKTGGPGVAPLIGAGLLLALAGWWTARRPGSTGLRSIGKRNA